MSSIINKLNAMQKFLDGSIDSAPAFVAGDTIHCWEILKNRPGTAKIAVGFQNSTARVNFPGGDITGRENEYFYAVISRGRGLTPGRADNLIYGSGGGLPLIALAEQMRDKMRAIRFDPNTDEVPDYVSLEDYTMEALQGGILIDAMICKIWVGTQMPQPSSLPENGLPI
jgi:hypothetical protein